MRYGDLIDRRPAGEEMARVLKTVPLQIAAGLDPSYGSIAHWNHGALHDVVEPLPEAKFGAALATLFDKAGIPVIEKRGRLLALGVQINRRLQLTGPALAQRYMSRRRLLDGREVWE